MAPKPKPWLRLYTETVRDRKLRREKPETRWLWIAVLCLARSSPEPGRLLLSDGSAVDEADLADEAALTPTQVRRGMAYFRTAGMVTLDGDVYVVTAWHGRQFTSDRSTERAAKSRSKAADGAAMQRPIDVVATPPENREQRTDPTTTSTDSSDAPADPERPVVDQPTTIKAIRLVAERQAELEAKTNPAGFIRTAKARMADPEDPDRQRIDAELAAGRTPEAVAAAWSTPTGYPVVDVAAPERPRLAEVKASTEPPPPKAVGLAGSAAARAALAGRTAEAAS